MIAGLGVDMQTESWLKRCYRHQPRPTAISKGRQDRYQTTSSSQKRNWRQTNKDSDDYDIKIDKQFESCGNLARAR